VEGGKSEGRVNSQLSEGGGDTEIAYHLMDAEGVRVCDGNGRERCGGGERAPEDNDGELGFIRKKKLIPSGEKEARYRTAN